MAIAEADRLYRAAAGEPQSRSVSAAAASIESEARLRWGVALWQADNRLAAAEQLRQAEAVFRQWPSLGDADATLGILYAELNDESEAAPRLEQYLRRSPEGEEAAVAREHLERLRVDHEKMSLP